MWDQRCAQMLSTGTSTMDELGHEKKPSLLDLQTKLCHNVLSMKEEAPEPMGKDLQTKLCHNMLRMKEEPPEPMELDSFRPSVFLLTKEEEHSPVKVKLESQDGQSFEEQESLPLPTIGHHDFEGSWWSNKKSEGGASISQDSANTESVEKISTGLVTCKPKTVLVTEDGHSPFVQIKQEPQDELSFGEQGPLSAGGHQDIARNWWSDEGFDSDGQDFADHEHIEHPHAGKKSRVKHEQRHRDASNDLESYQTVSGSANERAEQAETGEMQSTSQRFLNENELHAPLEHEGEIPKSMNPSNEQITQTSLMTYICNKCGKCFSDASSHIVHCSCPKDKLYTCDECVETFLDSSSLLAHQKIHIQEKQNTCSECGKKCVSALFLFKHQEKKHPGLIPKKEVYQCHRCVTCFSDLISLRMHVQEHAGKEILYQPADMKPEKNNLSLEHMNIREKVHSANECREGCTDALGPRIHMQELTGKEIITQPSDIVPKRETLIVKEITNSEKEHSCNECGKCFCDSLGLGIHRQEHKAKEILPPPGDTNPKSETLSQEKADLGEKQHLCTVCDKTFCDSKSLGIHQQEHPGEEIKTQPDHIRPKNERFTLEDVHLTEKQHSCNECEKTFCDALGLRIHQQEHTGENMLTQAFPIKLEREDYNLEDTNVIGKEHSCSDCGQTFCDSQSLTEHQKEHEKTEMVTVPGESRPEGMNASESSQKEKQHCCTECGKRYRYAPQLASHLKIHTGERPFPCGDCGKTFRDTILLRKHQRIHTEEKPYSCDECGKTFSVKGYLFRHQKIHTGKKPHICKLCGRGFTHASTLIKHHRTHTGVKPYKCEECGKCFSETSLVVKHQLTHTGEKPFTCSDCGKSFGRSCHLIRHLKMHSGELPYVCGECGQSFADSSSLTKHRLMHTGAKPYTCDLCGKNFGRASHLIRHQQTHTGEKPHTCDLCGRGFGALSTLQKHRRVHTGEKPFMCNECQKCFRDASALKIHKRVHTGEKPYVCAACGVSFSRSVYLKRHHVLHTGLNSYTCDCGKSFPSAYLLSEHQLKHTEVVTHTL
ncbi:zinc finger protein 585A-like isoform X2 [Ambystoma mexicanum]|uniref:zinc finger protein 585A-like isoform X2 n=1 Tax=Ambystoma mexicanum TaxID=8296 RepID=UPI0037E94453